MRLKGTPKEMGIQHGKRLNNEIKTLYTRFLDAQVLPYLNRQQKSVDETFLGLGNYLLKDEYAGGKFASRFLLDSAETLADEQPQDYLDELAGIAEGAGVATDQITLLNTFGDTLLGLLALSFYTERKEAPVLTAVVLPLEADRQDNDFDGQIDEAGEYVLAYEPVTQAACTGVPAGRMALRFEDPDGVQQEHLQIALNGVSIPEEERTYQADATSLTVTFNTGKYWRDTWNTLTAQASDRAVVQDPPPAHPHTMRQARVTIGGLQAFGPRALNAALTDPPGAATSFSIAATDGSLVARNFVLLDGNTAHDHTAVFVFEPAPTQENPKPVRYAVVGWAGAAWALTGMNEAGQAVTVNITETLENGVARGIDEAVLPRALGATFGAIGRMVLARDWSPAEFEAAMHGIRSASGVVVQLADAKRRTVTTCELRAGISGAPASCYGTAATAPAFRLPPDYTATFAAYSAFTDDATGAILKDLNPIEIVPQRFWSTEWLGSYQTYGRLDALLRQGDPGGDIPAWIELFRKPGVASLRNSMHSAIIVPGKEIWVGAGKLPSTESAFERFTFEELFP